MQEGEYVLHSVVQNLQGIYMCVTPVDDRLGLDKSFAFIPDEKIEVRIKGGTRTYYRDGRRIRCGVRGNPAKTIADYAVIRQRILSGEDPADALARPIEHGS
jgi:hypothetical protein